MSRADLQSLIIKSLRRVFPSADFTRGSSIWTQVIDPIVEYVGPDPNDLPVRAFLQSVLRAQHPEIAIDRSSEIDDLLLKPAESIMAPLARLVHQIKLRQSRADLSVHTLESLGELAANFNITPRAGEYAKTSVRCYYSAPVNRRVTPETYFETATGLRFYCLGVQQITSAQMSLNMEGDLYYWDVRTIAERPGAAYNVEPGAINRAPTDGQVVRVANLSRVTSGRTADTVEDLAWEMDQYPTVQQIGTRRGSVATIMRNLSGARVIEVVGMGDPFMERDVIRGGEVGSSIVVVGDKEAVGDSGRAIPDDDWDMFTNIIEDTTPAGASFGEAIGYSTGSVDGFYLIMNWTAGGAPVFKLSKVVYIDDVTRIRVADDVIPIGLTGIRWALVPAQLTLSGIPGGILWKDTPDGEVKIRSDEIHVGGRTDIYLLGSEVESASTSVTALDDEHELGYGANAQTLGTTVSGLEEWILLHDAPEKVVFGPAAAIRSSANTYYFASAPWANMDLSAIQAGQVFHVPSKSTTPRKYLINAVRKYDTGGGNWVLEVVLDDAPGVSSFADARIISRKMGIRPGKSAAILTKSGSAAENTYRITAEFEGASTDSSLPGMPTNEGCVFRLRSEKTIDADTAIAWRVIDDLDVDLTMPKVERLSGTDMQTIVGSANVSSSAIDFSLYGVTQSDILEIASGPDKGTYTIVSTPFGPGNHSLTIDKALTSTQIVRFRIFQGLRPIDTPLVSVTKVDLINRDGDLVGIDVPYGEALATYSSRFTNLNRGTKYETRQAILGIHSKNGFPGSGGGYNYNFGTNPIRILIWHDQLSYSPTAPAAPGDRPLDYGTNPVVGAVIDAGAGSHDLGTSAGRAGFADALNNAAGVVHQHFTWVEKDGLYYFVCYPIGAVYIALVFDNTTGVLDFAPTLDLTDYGLASYYAGMPAITTSDVWTPYPTASDLPSTLSLGQDMLHILDGPNAEHTDIIRSGGFDSSDTSKGFRYRLRGAHALYPERNRRIRIGVPSSGVGYVYVKDPTDVEVDETARFTTADTTGSPLVYQPDPTLTFPRSFPLGTDAPPPEHIYPDNLYISASGAVSEVTDSSFTVDSESNFVALGVRPGDVLSILYRDQIFADIFPTILAAEQTLMITRGDETVSVTFSPGSWTEDAVVDKINGAYGSSIALVDALGRVRIRCQSELLFSGTAVNPSGGILQFEDPNYGLTQGTNRALSYGKYDIIEVSPTKLKIYGTVDLGDGDGDKIQYQILRKGVQRYTAAQVAAMTKDAGLYKVPIELVSRGVGDEYNIDAGMRLVPEGVRLRGYRLSTESSALSFSTLEKVWMHLDNWFQHKDAAADRPEYDQLLVDSGVQITYDRSPLVASVQALLGSDEERDTLQDILARHLYPYYVNMSVSYAGGSLESVTTPQVKALITGRSPREPLDVSDVISVLTQYGANHVDTPIRISVVRHMADRSIEALVGDDRIETPRLAGFLPGDIVLTRRA